MARVSQGRPGSGVDNDDVDFCMIDLHDLKRTANCIFPRDCCGRLDDIAFAAPLAPNPGRVGLRETLWIVSSMICSLALGNTQVPERLPVALGWSTSTVPNVL